MHAGPTRGIVVETIELSLGGNKEDRAITISTLNFRYAVTITVSCSSILARSKALNPIYQCRGQ